MKILHLTLLRRWFDEIASGRKTEEYRTRSPYWAARLESSAPARLAGVPFRRFDEVHFRNGYAKLAPFMRVEWKDCLRLEHPQHGPVYAIKLGAILEIKNHHAAVSKERERKG